MEKRLRFSLRTSAEDFLSSAASLPYKSSKTTVKALINTLAPTSNLTSTLPVFLRSSILQSIVKFKNLADSTSNASPKTPPAKRLRRSSRNKQDDEASHATNCEDERQSIAEKLRVFAHILRLCVFHPENVFSASDLLPAAQELHDNLIFFESDSGLLSEIATLCEDWWKGNLSGKETLITQSLPVILSRSLTLKKKVDVHRVYALRDAFMLFDFEDDSIEDLKHLLIRCVISPLYLKTEDGLKFIAFLFGLSAQLAKEVFAMIKSQIPYRRKSMVEAYGEIIFRAWKAVEGSSKEEIEKGFLQGLIEDAICASSEALAASVRRILRVFVSNRTIIGVEKLIFHLTEPVIFRSLQASNSNVRQNALHLLLDLFPLEDPNATKEVKDTLLEKQLFLLEKLLVDECPDVRVVSVEGSCRILCLFWEIIPSSTITKIITIIFDHMTHDACTEVRLSTVNGVMYLLGNPQSHEVLKVLLPRLGHLILDSTLAVRGAVIDLLLLLKDIRNFHFHKVVSLDTLCYTLANDQPLVARKITKLLVPSYFPSKVTEEEACKRCITLIKRSPTAGARFCEFVASEGASRRSLMKLFKVLISLTLSSVKLEQEQIVGLLLAASHLCSKLAHDGSFLTALKEALPSDKLKRLFTIASTARAQSSVCNMVSATSPGAVDDLFEECLGLTTECGDLSGNVEKQIEVRSAHKMIWSCGWFNDMFEALVGFLQKAAYGCHVTFAIDLGKNGNHAAKQRKNKSSTKTSLQSRYSRGKKSSDNAKNNFFMDYAIAAGVSWQITDLLQSENSRQAILESRNLENAFNALKVISEASILNSLKNDCMDTSPVAAYMTLTLLMSLHNIRISGNKDPTQASIIDLTMDHLLHCANKIFRTNEHKRPENMLSVSMKSSKRAPVYETNTRESQTGASLSKHMGILNVEKMLLAVLKFIVDANAMNLVPNCQERCLNFALEKLKFIISNLRRHFIARTQFLEEDLKENFHCLKSSFTYAAKLLNLVFKTCEPSSPQPRAYDLVNEMFNLVISIEEFYGYGYAARFAAIVEPWIPDLILALGSFHLRKHTQEEGVGSVLSRNDTLPLSSWKNILAVIEVQELIILEEDTEFIPNSRFSAFKKLVETMTQMLRTNNNVLDAVGAILLADSLQALQSKNYTSSLGLLHFVCVKLVQSEDLELKELKFMLASFEQLHSKLETETEELGDGDHDRQKLLKAIALLEPVFMSSVFD
ncbi:LOW QUALITY PROTEIN: uncharacterized protein LOC142536987 [Primulina tabacum]|uniref:LOW QUALITY PROTEIN: uncharacterized protein LOC142536987 n=1 Tax=Primulina tabacum TaxID=48773 RepID=UPI003F5ACF3B